MKYIILIVLSGVLVSAFAQTDGLVTHYSFDQEVGFYAQERVENVPAGKAILGAYFLEDGLYLDGTDDELESAKSEITRLDGSEMSIAVWFKADAIGGHSTILSKGTAYELSIDGGKLFFEVVLEGFGRMSAVTEETIEPSQVYHVLVSRSGTDMSFFVNGEEQTNVSISNPVSTNLYPSNTDIYIGSGKSKDYFDGIIYDIKIFDKSFDAASVQNMLSANDAPIEVPKVSVGANIFLVDHQGMVDLEAVADVQNGSIVSSSWSQLGGSAVSISTDQAEIDKHGKYVFQYEVTTDENVTASGEVSVWNFSPRRKLIYVDPQTGDDTSGSGSLSDPLSSIEKAISKADEQENSVILLAPGEYVLSEKIVLPPTTSLIGAGRDHTTFIAGSALWTEIAGSPANCMIEIDEMGGPVYVGHFSIDGSSKRASIGITASDCSDLEIDRVNIFDTYFSGLIVIKVENSTFHDLKLVNTSWGSNAYSAGAIGIGGVKDVDLYNLDISEGIINKPTNWGYGIKAYSIGGTRAIERLKIYNSKIETATEGFWNNGEAPNIAIEFHSTSFIDCEIFNVEANQTLSLVPNRFISGTKNMRLHHNKVIGSGGVAIESYMNNCEIDHNYLIGEYFTIKGFNNNIYEDYFVHHNVFSDIYPKQGASQGMSYGGLKNVKFYNNTIYNTIFKNMPIIELFGGVESDNIDITNNIFYTTEDGINGVAGGAKVVLLKSGSTATRVSIRNNATFNYDLGISPQTNSDNSTQDPQLELIESDSYWIPVAKSGSWVEDAGIDVGLPFTGSAPDIGAGEANVGLVKAPVIDNLMPYHTSIEIGESINISSSASDADGEVQEMEVLINGSVVEIAQAATVSHTYTPEATGVYSILVKAVDNDGLSVTKRSEFFVSAEPLSANNDNNLEMDMKIYPNPTEDGHLVISSSLFQDGKEYTVRLVDLSGRKVNQAVLKSNNGELTYQLENSAISIGILQVQTENKLLTMKVILK